MKEIKPGFLRTLPLCKRSEVPQEGPGHPLILCICHPDLVEISSPRFEPREDDMTQVGRDIAVVGIHRIVDPCVGDDGTGERLGI